MIDEESTSEEPKIAIIPLTLEERGAIKKLALEHLELMYCIVEEILEQLPSGDKILINGLERWRKKDER
uniref:Uncharacterized protein n=1 Tax=viral metagenome TaxID=1070528 RepID=A0A6M3M641_9ZZZZ